MYWYYIPEVRETVEIMKHTNGDKVLVTNAEEAFGTLSNTFMTLFFALYTIGDSQDTLLQTFKNSLTVNIGYILFGTFHIANITIMINMLIAMMTKSFEDIIVIYFYFILKMYANLEEVSLFTSIILTLNGNLPDRNCIWSISEKDLLYLFH